MPLKSRDMIDASDPRVAQIGHPAPPWLINYADLMTELVCFFVILYALSATLQKDVNKAAQDIQEKIDNKEVSGEVQYSKEGLRITLTEKGEFIFFESGRAELTERAKELIKKIIPELQKLKNEVIVEGHTDNVPIRTSQFSSNWELSTARATSVVKFLIDDIKYPPEKLAAIGYGEFKPAAPNDTPENKSKNRRVVFFIKNIGQDKVIKDENKNANKKGH
jgi:chemotaxis protein MotB